MFVLTLLTGENDTADSRVILPTDGNHYSRRFMYTPTPNPTIPPVQMYYVYILKSKKDGKLYTGSTNNLRRRLIEHYTGKSFATKSRLPLELVYYEAYKSEVDARKREANLKLRSRAFTQLKKRTAQSLV
mgnify:CR=1 FL=1